MVNGYRLRDYNVLVTFHQNEKTKAEEEIVERVQQADLVLEDMMESSVAGLVILRIKGDGKEAVRRLRAFAMRFPDVFRHTHRWIPIEEWVSSEPEAMISAARTFGARIVDGDRWRIDVEKRRYQGGSSQDIVRMLAEHIHKGMVDLDGPEMVLLVQIIEDFAGFSLVRDDEVLDINLVRKHTGLARIS
jgi:tRNA(Ser,Leu) C12 N-acetylase TAN1